MNFNIGVIYRRFLASINFVKIGPVTAVLYLRLRMNCGTFPRLLIDVGGAGYGKCQHNAFSNNGFHENRCNESRTLLKGVKGIFLSSSLSFDLYTIRHRKCPLKFTEFFWLLWQSTPGKPYFTEGSDWSPVRASYIYRHISTKLDVRHARPAVAHLCVS